MPREDGAGADFSRMRAARRARLLEAMEGEGLDALILGRPGNVRFASGARQLWRAGAFPFAPSCVVVGRTQRVHLLSTWDDGVPDEIGHEGLYGLTWNPAHLQAELRSIPGLSESRVVGTDSVSPSFLEVLPLIAPHSSLADATGLLRRVRETKTPEEVTCLVAAATLAGVALSDLRRAVAPGVTERHLLGVYCESLARLGAPTPASEGVAFATGRNAPVRFGNLVSDRAIGANELVVLTPSALYAGYEGTIGRTISTGDRPPAGTEELADRCEVAMRALIAACLPGRTGADLYRAWAATGEGDPVVALAHGLGIGTEAPLVGYGLGAAEVLRPGMALCVQSWVTEAGTGGYLLRDVVLVHPDGPEVLTTTEGPTP
jgi:Xaa-Pro aminopeptidase